MAVTGETSETISSYVIGSASGTPKLVGKIPMGKGTNLPLTHADSPSYQGDRESS